MQQGRTTGEVVVSHPHVHRWLRISGCVGLFHCLNDEHNCPLFAVCPGCLNSLDIAIRARDGSGVILYWCPLHARREGL